jgi:hypothetical protein
MNPSSVHVRELSAWGLDVYEYRPDSFELRNVAAPDRNPGCRSPLQQSDVLLDHDFADLREAFLKQAERSDLLAEMTGLTWSLGVVDLRPLMAFQRRLFFSSETFLPPIPAAKDWPSLLALTFAPAQPVKYDVSHDHASQMLVLRSNNPNLHVRTTGDVICPLRIHAGSPFFEVACFRDRWFLRDGYHRAFAFLRAGVFEIPAVIVQAKTIEELGATKPWFFSEEVLFSADPPRVLDFLDDNLILEYDRPPLIKTLRITMDETFASAFPTGEES